MTSLEMPTLESARLRIRPFALEDLPDVHRLLDVDGQDADREPGERVSLEERAEWLRWTILGYRQLANLHQPPYGDRAIVHKITRGLIGACGFVPCLDAFQQLPGLASSSPTGRARLCTAEFGLFYAVAPPHRGQGYAVEAARSLVDYAFGRLKVARIVATTTYGNAASIGVMRRLGMQVERNPLGEPPWLQVVGVLENG